MSVHNLILQMAFMYSWFWHFPTHEISPNLYTGPDPKVKDIYALHDKGVKTIVSLRLHEQPKKEKLCQQLGMRWYQIKSGVFLAPTDEQFDKFRAILNNPGNLPCYTACEVGSDRVGVYLAAYRAVDQHWTEDQIAQGFRDEHQKTWWPAFRKYKPAVIAYAKRQEAAGHDAQTAIETQSANKSQPVSQ